mmetsp:Transcript_5335/g.13525  ORF Transcript_5335/g.13525 Transcript_5335/m.13525 type:complete len:607 (+) Transcript_5335:274-2094(+)|eukprot:CAMPEP_0206271552 /NCGR_PEP_ID=MMETSP0047_2-20121206/33495_1 /ASSEMBLY_ACC=CAM_ASM_000192 /TAXON_ID=195065 /ORGANISM="Chroomonas mesostigmatica_cf, Strain CCMP1168" /LENGTH=606 /DNA_ID=CAMNT_0053700333 /DNA_START=262 /DNA_END=2082 /DNA_ORIENTATION=-
MDVVYAVQQYVTRMTESVTGMKSLLLDKETTVIVSMVFSRSKVLEKEVFLFQRLDAERRGQMLHLKALVFLRPTRENIELLAKELHDPKFGEYHLFFSNVLTNDAVRTLAQADEFELVKQIHEFYADFYSLTPCTFSLQLPANSALTTPLADRTRDGLFALLLALKKKPAIRYQLSSHDAGHIAALLSQHIDQHQETLDFGPSSRQDDVPPLLLILDRTDDPLTPLLNQWTYQAMVHELLGIRNNLVEIPPDIVQMPKGGADAQSIVLSPVSDDFYSEIMYSDFGSLHDSVLKKLEEFKKANPAMTQGANVTFKTIGEMQKFVEKYPQMNKMKDNVSKHVNLLQCLSKVVDRKDLMQVSELEQQLACVQDHKAHLKQVLAMIGGTGEYYKVSDKDKMRLALLYVLRYQKEASKGTIDQIKAILPNTPIPGSFSPHIGLPEESMPAANKMPEVLLSVCGASQRTPQGDLFNRGVSAVVTQGLKGFSKGQDNAYMLHEPLLGRILRQVDKGKLPEENYPYKMCSSQRAVVDTMRALKRGPNEVIVFFVGGGTFAEARAVHKFNEQNKHMRVIMGATSFLTTSTFLESVAARAHSAGRKKTAPPEENFE